MINSISGVNASSIVSTQKKDPAQQADPIKLDKAAKKLVNLLKNEKTEDTKTTEGISLPTDMGLVSVLSKIFKGTTETDEPKEIKLPNTLILA